MAMLFAVLVLGVFGSKIPSDADIAARLEEAIRTELHPGHVQVIVKRNSPFSMTFERVDISISDFNADNLLLALSQTPAPAPAGGPAHAAPARGGKQVRLKNAHLQCERFVAGGLPVRALEWHGSDVYLPWDAVKSGAFQVTAAQSVTGYVLLEQQGLTQFLRTCELPITNPVLQITPAECRVSGNTRTWISMPVQLTGHLSARNGAVLYLDNPRLRVAVVPLPTFVSDRLLRDINPLSDLNKAFKLPAPLAITRTTQQNGTLRVDGVLRFPLPEK